MKLLNFWNNFDYINKPFVYSEDKVYLKNHINDYNNYNDLISNSNFGFINKGFHINLLPVPYVGDILNAKIYILMLNPGFCILDCYAESYSEEYCKLHIANLKQKLNSDEFPFYALNPKIIWHNGGQYWTNKFKDIIELISNDHNYSFTDSLSYLSKRVSMLELVPYHSKSFSLSANIINKLYTVQLMKNFLKDYVIPKVIKNEACIICTRASTQWELQDTLNDNIIVYKGALNRSASLSKGTEGYKKIVEFLFK